MISSETNSLDTFVAGIFWSRTLPLNAHCNILEFTIASYRKLLYDILPPYEKKQYHSKAADILQQEARKCSTCGSGSYLAMSSEEESPPTVSSLPCCHDLVFLLLQPARRLFESSLMFPKNFNEQPTTRLSKQTKLMQKSNKRNIFSSTYDLARRRETAQIRSISILPVHDDIEEIEGEELCYTERE